MNSNMNDDELENEIEQNWQEINRLEDELTELDATLFKTVKNLNSVDEIHDDSPGWGTIILAFLAGWMLGD